MRKGRTLLSQHGVLVLSVHEVENLFLHPDTLRVLLQQNGQVYCDAIALIRSASDTRAGSWVFQYAMATNYARSLPNISRAAKERAKSLTWTEINESRDDALNNIVNVSGYDAENANRLRRILAISARVYGRQRDKDCLWRICEGKQVLNSVASQAGFAGAPAFIQATFAAWERHGADIPQEISRLRQYVGSL